MRRSLVVLALCLVAGALDPGAARGQGTPPPDAERAAITSTVLPFFRALKRGNVNRLKSYLSPEQYRQYQVLLEQNREYPRFLRQYYRGASFQLGDVAVHDDHAAVAVTISTSGGPPSPVTLHLKKDLAGQWRIAEQDRQ